MFSAFSQNVPGIERARARAPGPRVALGPPALLTIGDYDQRLFARARNFGASFVSHVFRRYFRIYVEDPGVEHEPRRFFNAF